MEGFNSILDYIGRTNLFNFAIFLAIIIYVCKKINLNGILEGAKNKVKENIETSENTKAESESHLKDIEQTLAHIEDEIDSIIKKSENNAKLVGEKILEDAQKTISGIKENSQKAVENRSALLKNDILKRASGASIEVAKNHIINELNNNYELHNRLIDESIEAINEAG